MAILASEIMTKKLKTVEPETSISVAFEFATTNKIRHLLVVEKKTQKFIGILSDRDLNKIISPFAGTSKATPQDNATTELPVSVIMHKNVIFCKPTDTVKLVVEKMLQKKINGMPILDDNGKLVGIITTDDLLKLLLRYT